MKKAKRSNPPDEGFLGLSGKTWLILGGVAVAGLIAWKLYQRRRGVPAGPTTPGPGTPYTPPLDSQGRPRPGPEYLLARTMDGQSYWTKLSPGTIMNGIGAAPPCPTTPQPVAERGPEDEFGGGGELL